MTKEQYQNANCIQSQLAHLSNTLDHFEKYGEYDPDHEIRTSEIFLRFGVDERSPIVRLSEGEVECIKSALESYERDLERRFEKL